MTTQLIINKLLAFSNEYLIPVMCVAFTIGLLAKFSLWFLKRSQLIYAKQIEKKIYMYLIDKEKTSFEIISLSIIISLNYSNIVYFSIL